MNLEITTKAGLLSLIAPFCFFLSRAIGGYSVNIIVLLLTFAVILSPLYSILFSLKKLSGRPLWCLLCFNTGWYVFYWVLVFSK
jgi:hypothetical protein